MGKKCSNVRGFSLFEMSMAFVALGLVAGGVLAWKAYKRSSELKQVAADIENFQSATQLFKGKYFALPGDMLNATRYWGAQAGETLDGPNAVCSSLDHAHPATGTPTCNGNGDGFIGTAGAYTNDSYERFRYWQHLVNGGFIVGSYTGVHGPAGTHQHIAGSNSPPSKIQNAHYSVLGMGVVAGMKGMFDGDYGNVLEFRNEGLSASGYPILRPGEAQSIDKKLDDTMPATGKITSYTPAIQPNCATSADSIAQYNDRFDENACSLIYKLAK